MNAFSAVELVTGAGSLVAFVLAIFFYAYRARLKARERIILAAPEEDRAKVVNATGEFFNIPTAGMSDERKERIILEQLRIKARRELLYFLFAILLAVILAAIFIFGSEPSPTPEPTAELRLEGRGYKSFSADNQLPRNNLLTELINDGRASIPQVDLVAEISTRGINFDGSDVPYELRAELTRRADSQCVFSYWRFDREKCALVEGDDLSGELMSAAMLKPVSSGGTIDSAFPLIVHSNNRFRCTNLNAGESLEFEMWTYHANLNAAQSHCDAPAYEMSIFYELPEYALTLSTIRLRALGAGFDMTSTANTGGYSRDGVEFTLPVATASFVP